MNNEKRKWGAPYGLSWAAVTSGILVIAAAALFSRLRGAGFMLYPGLLAGVALIVFGGLGLLMQNKPAGRRMGVALFLRRCIILTFALWIVSFAAVMALIFSRAGGDAQTNAGAAILFGAGLDGDRPSAVLRSRLDKAGQWLRENPDAFIIVSGGQGAEETDTEARVMARELVKAGISPQRILAEEQALDSEQNVGFSREILGDIGYDGPVALITNEFHLYRVKLLAAQAGLEPVGVPAETPYLYLKVTYFLREYFSLLACFAGI